MVKVGGAASATAGAYELGAQRFGWKARPLTPGALRDGRVRIGWGMATAVYPAHRSAASGEVHDSAPR